MFIGPAFVLLKVLWWNRYWIQDVSCFTEKSVLSVCALEVCSFHITHNFQTSCDPAVLLNWDFRWTLPSEVTIIRTHFWIRFLRRGGKWSWSLLLCLCTELQTSSETLDLWFYLQTHSEHQRDQDGCGQGQSLGPPLHGEEAALQTPEAAAFRPRADEVSKTTQKSNSTVSVFFRWTSLSVCGGMSVSYEMKLTCDLPIYNTLTLLKSQSIILKSTAT